MNTLIARVIILFSGVLFLSSSLFASVTYEESAATRTHVARGTDDVVMLSFKLGATTSTQFVKSFQFENTSSHVQFGLGVDKAKIYLDSNGNGTVDSGEQTISPELTFTTGANPIQTFTLDTSQEVSSINVLAFLITYDIDPSQASLTEDANLTLKTITTVDGLGDLNLATITNSNTPTQNNVTITGVKTLTVQDISPSVVLPGQEMVPMLYVSVLVEGENIFDPSNIDFTLTNDSDNFVTSSSDESGVRNVYMYRGNFPPPFREGLEDDSAIKTVFTEDASRGSNELKFSFPSYPTLFSGIPKTVTSNFYVFYDIGDEISVTTSTKVQAKLSSFIGVGSSSVSNIQWPLSNEENLTAEALVAGLSADSLTNIVPDNKFGEETTVPILKFTLRANHTPITLNSITVINDGTVPFVNEANGTNGIVHVRLYEDTDSNGSYSVVHDTLIGDLELNGDTAAGNQTDRVEIPLYTAGPPTVNGYLLPQYDEGESNELDYPQNNEKIVFVTYEMGEVIKGGKNASGNVTFVAEARIGNVVGSANITIQDEVTSNVIRLTGASNNSPIAADPNAEVSFEETNLVLKDAIDISPDSVIQGQVKVPMLYIHLGAEDVFTSTNVTIFNEKLSFLQDSSGASKVWLYRDDNNDQKFDSGDSYLSATSSLDSSSEANMDSVPLGIGDNYLLVLYDIGQNATIDNDEIRAQFLDIKGKEGETINLGGEVPFPLDAASLDVSTKPVGQTTVQTAVDGTLADVTDPTATFNVVITLTNNGDSAISIDELSPRLYHSSLSGRDISYEFEIEPKHSLPFSLNAGTSTQFTFDVRHVDTLSTGTAYIDSYTKYSLTNTEAVHSRYQTKSSWVSAATETPVLNLIEVASTYYWRFPPHIEKIEIKRGSSSLSFVNFGAIRVSDQLDIFLKDKGSFLDLTSMDFQLNGTELLQSTQENSNTYLFDSSTGVVTIHDTGTSDGELKFNVNDSDGNALEQADISYKISSQAQVHRPLFYPNPYPMSSETLRLGFNLTQPATVKLYLYNYNGRLVFQSPETSYTSIGYHELEISRFNTSIVMGVYVGKLVITGADGKKAMVQTELAVY